MGMRQRKDCGQQRPRDLNVFRALGNPMLASLGDVLLWTVTLLCFVGSVGGFLYDAEAAAQAQSGQGAWAGFGPRGMLALSVLAAVGGSGLVAFRGRRWRLAEATTDGAGVTLTLRDTLLPFRRPRVEGIPWADLRRGRVYSSARSGDCLAIVLHLAGRNTRLISRLHDLDALRDLLMACRPDVISDHRRILAPFKTWQPLPRFVCAVMAFGGMYELVWFSIAVMEWWTP